LIHSTCALILLKIYIAGSQYTELESASPVPLLWTERLARDAGLSPEVFRAQEDQPEAQEEEEKRKKCVEALIPPGNVSNLATCISFS
jgi:hypothetical protein